MKTYLIGYDLRRPGQDYSSLFEAIKSYPSWYHMIDSTWLIGTDRSAAEIRDHLLQHIDHNDALFVGRLSGEAAWYGLAVDGTNWLKGQLAA